MNGYAYSEALNIEINNLAIDLATVFEEWSEKEEEVFYLSEEGMEKMYELFGSIHPHLRANVFATLLVELEERGISYDIEQFQHTETVH